MYSGSMIEQLIDMVARAENHATQQIITAREPVAPPQMYTSNFWYDSSATQPMLIGVA